MEIAPTVWSVFKAYGAGKHTPNVRVTKIGCTDGCPPKVPVGQVVEGRIAIDEVAVGLSFNIAEATIVQGGNGTMKNLKGVKYDYWCTSIIQKVLSGNTFETKNSIYKWEAINQ